MLKSVWAISLCLAAGAMAQPPVPAPFGVDLQGRRLTRLDSPRTRAVVVLFVATDCPISKRYLPEWERLAENLGSRGVEFYTVYPNPGETVTAIRAQETAFGERVRALLDPRQSLVRLADARVTPEAVVFVPEHGGLRVVYRGRIDDRYMDLGHQRPQATRNELELAVKAVLAGAPVQPPGGRAVGCAIVPLVPLP